MRSSSALAGWEPADGFTQLIIYSMVPLAVLLLLPFVKILTTSLTLGSGGSGGVFSPGLAIGASVGGAIGILLHLLTPALVPAESVPAFVIVGMIALFGAIANAPIAVLIMVVEMVGSFTLLVPAMGAVAVSKLFLGDTTIFRAQVPTKAQSGAHRGEYDRETLERILVRDAMIPREAVITFSPQMSRRKSSTSPRQQGIPVFRTRGRPLSRDYHEPGCTISPDREGIVPGHTAGHDSRSARCPSGRYP